jgi:type II secretory pathway pseudopilin PulG
MAVLLVTMSVMAIMMTVALPTWRQLVRREKEAELVFRGEQYARAIQLFQTKSGPGTLPPTIDLLVEQRFLRKKFKDPITNDDFAPLVQVAGGAAGGTAAGAAQPGRQGGAAPQPVGGAGQRGPAGAQPGTTPGAAPVGGIMGVTSKSKEQSIRLYKGRNHYNEWQFLPVARAAAPGAGGSQAPGQRGGPQGGQRGAPGTGPQPPFGTGRQTAPAPGPGPNNPNQPNNPFQFPGGRSGR